MITIYRLALIVAMVSTLLVAIMLRLLGLKPGWAYALAAGFGLIIGLGSMVIIIGYAGHGV